MNYFKIIICIYTVKHKQNKTQVGLVLIFNEKTIIVIEEK